MIEFWWEVFLGMLLVASPFLLIYGGVAIWAVVDLIIQRRRCPACKGHTAAVLAVGPDLSLLCSYHRTRLRIIERKEAEVLGEWPNIS
jgi:hypothetical protein